MNVVGAMHDNIDVSQESHPNPLSILVFNAFPILNNLLTVVNMHAMSRLICQ